MLNLSSDVLHNELETARGILQKWLDLLEKGMPGVDLPASEETQLRWLLELRGELRVVVGKCDTLVDILNELA